MLGPRIGKFNADGSPNSIPGHNLPLLMVGVIILWFGWFGFNAGSTLGFTDANLIARICINTLLSAAAGVTTADKLAGKRPYIIIGAFVIGMMLTPPDVISQSLLAIPIWLLFELGLIASRLFLNVSEKEEEVIMQNDEFALIEESSPMYRDDIPEDDHDEEGNPLSDDEMEKLFDDVEQEEEDNSRDDEDDSDEEGSEDDSDKKPS